MLDGAAVTGFTSFLKFFDQNFQEGDIPDLFKPFFNKPEVYMRLMAEDRFILCFGVDSSKRPQLDFGLVLQREMPEFRRHYLRKEWIHYDTTFESKFLLLHTFRAVYRESGSTGAIESLRPRDSKTAFALPGFTF